MRICLDLDGVICEIRKGDQTYPEVRPLPGAVERIKALKDAGHYIIIQTARHWKTCQGNVGLILARQGLNTLQWLERHEIPYDELHFGKPWADIYIDDNAIRFQSWDQIEPNGSNLPTSSETKLRGEDW
jgi:capsule biosynthesis phosphatase